MRSAKWVARIGFVVVLMVTSFARAAEPETAGRPQFELGFVYGADVDYSGLWGPGFGGALGYTFPIPVPVYAGIAYDEFPHEDTGSSFGVLMGEVGYDLGIGSQPQLLIRPKLGIGGARDARPDRQDGGFLLAPGAEVMLFAGVILSVSARYNAIFHESAPNNAIVFNFGLGFGY